jgi:hypothetical protein
MATEMTTRQLRASTLPLRRSMAAIALAILLLSMGQHTGAQSATTADVKAAFLYNFARFTEWPSDAFSSASAPIVIGVAGDEFVRRALDHVIYGKVVGTHRLTTVQIKDAEGTAGVQMLYIGGVAASRVEGLLRALNDAPVLTVGDVDRFCEDGGMINFLIVDNRVRFEIRLDVTEQSRLKVSSRVLALAKTIHGKSKQ